MTNKKSTKRALLLSALSLLMCVSMLIGSTFAWFTDNVTSGKNTIQSGNLDVELYYTYDAAVAGDVNSTAWIKVTKDTDVFGYNLWEPGYTKVAYFKVENEGSLELKYQLAADVYEEKAGVNQTGAEFLLSDYIKTALVNVGATRDQILAMDGTPLKNSYDMSKGSLAANGTAVVGLAIWMPTTVGNVANHDGKTVPEITFGINLLATQKDKESDSFGDDYDKNAWVDGMKVYNAQDLQAALANGKNAVLQNNIETTDVIKLEKDVAIDLNGKTLSASLDVSDDVEISIENGTIVNTSADVSGIQINKGIVTLTDVEITSARHGVRVEGGEVVINDGIYKVSGSGLTQHALNVSHGGKATINGGTFIGPKGLAADSGAAVNVQANSTVIINGGNFSNGLNDTLANAGTLIVKGGAFDQNPTAYVTSGFKAVDNGNGTYTVLPDVGADLTAVAGHPGVYKSTGENYYVATPDALVDVFSTIIPVNMERAQSVSLLADMDMSGRIWEPLNNQHVTINGYNHTISNITCKEGSKSGLFGYAGGVAINDLTLKNVTSKGSQAGIFAGLATGLKLNNCFVEGDNTVTYYKTAETWNGIGAITGVCTESASTLNVTIAEGATVTLTKGDMVTESACVFNDLFGGYLLKHQGTVTNNGKIAIGVSTTAGLVDAVKNAPVGSETAIVMADGTYAGDIAITVAALGKSGGDVVIKAAEGAKPVITGTVTIGYRHQTVGAASYNAKITFDGITFDHAEANKHCLDVQDVESFYMVNCTVIGDGECGLSSPRGNGTGAAKIEKCKFVNAGLQLLGKMAQTLTIDDCEFEESVINVQAGGPLGPTIQNSKFDITLKAAHSGGSFYVIRNSNAGANIKVKNCEISVDAEQGFNGVAGPKGWGVFVNRIASFNMDVEDVKITMTDAALAQSELKVATCQSTGKINMTNVTLNGEAVQ